MKSLYALALTAALAGCANQEYTDLKTQVARQAATIALIQSQYNAAQTRLEQLETSQSGVLDQFRALENRINVYHQSSDLDKVTEQKQIEFDIILLSRRIHHLETRAARTETDLATEIHAREDALGAERQYTSEQTSRLGTALTAEQTARQNAISGERTYTAREVQRLEESLTTITRFIAGYDTTRDLPTGIPSLYTQLQNETAQRQDDIARIDSTARTQSDRLTTTIDKTFGGSDQLNDYSENATLLQRIQTLGQWIRKLHHDQQQTAGRQPAERDK